jgi:hypothetical protein
MTDKCRFIHISQCFSTNGLQNINGPLVNLGNPINFSDAPSMSLNAIINLLVRKKSFGVGHGIPQMSRWWSYVTNPDPWKTLYFISSHAPTF